MGPLEKPWTAFYGPNVREALEAPSYRNLPDLISSVADTYGKAKAFTCCLPNGMNGTLTYADVNEMSDAMAVYLREVAGLSAGDRVAVQMPNCQNERPTGNHHHQYQTSQKPGPITPTCSCFC